MKTNIELTQVTFRHLKYTDSYTKWEAIQELGKYIISFDSPVILYNERFRLFKTNIADKKNYNLPEILKKHGHKLKEGEKANLHIQL